jgi:uncharacterized repeat protein (TIGR01451 family)
MDESYLEWLSSIPGSNPERALRIAERFPTYEALRSATREQLASVEGLTPQDIDALLGLLGRAPEEDSNHLFLCPKCGSFVGTNAGTCPFCGVSFDESSEDDLSEGLDQFLKEADQPAHICQTCGAAIAKDATACAICDRRYAPEELALLPGLDAPLDDAAPFCPRCGAYLSTGESECAICGSPMTERPEVTSGGKGVVKDFLTRWQRMAEPGPPIAEADRLREELDHFDRLLEADASLERAWANRAKVLEKLGRPKEAMESFAKAAELNPARDDQYRLEVQNLLRVTGDASVLPPRWKQPAATSPPAASDKVDPRLLDALAHYDSLLTADPTLAVAWRTKAEILGRLGRTEEAHASREQAERLERAEEGSLRSAAAGLRSSGLATPGLSTAGFTNGRTNGRVNGRTNGHVNGRTNGRVNGVSEGRVNGLAMGATNGLTFGRGATNGLVNGNGFTNGRRNGRAAPRIPAQPHWSRSVTGIAAVVALMLIVPILASMLSPSPVGPSSLIRIDGDFSDWAAIPAYADSPVDQMLNPAVNLLAVKVATEDRNLFVNARVQGLLFSGGAPNETDSVFVFVDEDANRLTGYPIGDLGVDSAVEVFGWSQIGSIEHGVLALKFDASGGPRSNDWSRFVPSGSADAAFSGQNLELRMTVPVPKTARLLAYAADNLGNRDPADGSVRVSLPTLVVEQATVAPDVVTGRTAILRVTLNPLGGIPHATALNLTRLGTSTDSVDLSVYRDDGSGGFDSADVLLSTVPVTGTTASLPVGLDFSSPAILWVEASWSNMTAASTFGLSVDGVALNGTASFRSTEIGQVYLASAPTDLRIDGAFGDWQGRTYGQDLLGDVTNRTGALEYNANVDILATAVDEGANFTGYVRVDGRILGGQDIPTSRSRTYASASDTDLDTVPDWVETSLGSSLERDFNNDNVTDDRTGLDVDVDGLVDYPDGTDCWLNTTIPAWYPAPYAGRFVTRFICPVGLPPQEGVDVVYAYVDADNSSTTGQWSDVSGRLYGFDYAIAVIGRNGVVNSSGLYAYAPGQGVPWQLVQGVPVGLDSHRLEFAINATTMNLQSGYRVVYIASDWRLGYDVALPDAAVARFAVGARAATNVVINEISPQPNPEWIEVANPTASPIPLSGWNLALVRGGRTIVVFTFTTQILGPFGSGTEYLRATLAGGLLPNGNSILQLRQGTTIIDQTTYSQNVNNGQTWARLKDPVTGVPMDTNNDAADFYISTLPSSGQANDRHRPTITVAKTASRSVAAPGQSILYAVYYNNTNTGNAKTVWVNDTLPSGVTYTTSSVPYNSVSGSMYRWIFADVTPGAHSFTITVAVTPATTDGQLLGNVVTLNYVDQVRRSLPGSTAWANTTVSRPTITVVKTATPGSARPGDPVTFTIYYNNTGSAAAGTVTIKDSLPNGMVYQSASLAPTWMNGRTFYWNLTNVAPGPHSLTLTALVDPTFTGSVLVNWAFLNYTTTGGYALIGSNSSTIVSIPELSDMIFVAVVPLLIIGLKVRARRQKE